MTGQYVFFSFPTELMVIFMFCPGKVIFLVTNLYISSVWKYQPRGYDVRHRRNDRQLWYISTPNRHPPRRHPGNLLNVCSREWLSASQFVGTRFVFLSEKNPQFSTQNHCGSKQIRQTNSWNKKTKGFLTIMTTFLGVLRLGGGPDPKTGTGWKYWAATDTVYVFHL